jgi:hypothetical protein
MSKTGDFGDRRLAFCFSADPGPRASVGKIYERLDQPESQDEMVNITIDRIEDSAVFRSYFPLAMVEALKTHQDILWEEMLKHKKGQLHITIPQGRLYHLTDKGRVRA